MSTTENKGLQLRYFVLKPKGKDQYAVASRKALLTYADIICSENPSLATDLRDWVNREIENAKT